MYSRRRKVELDAVAKPVRSFQTPIQQLKASAPQLTEDEAHKAGEHPDSIACDDPLNNVATVLGVRTMSSTILLDINPTSDQATSVETHELVNVARSDVGDCAIMDMTVTATERTLALLVNSAGAIYRCSVLGGPKTVCVFISFCSLAKFSYDLLL